jgi:hypothetical protein
MKTCSYILYTLVGVFLLSVAADAQITGLCNTGQTAQTASGCTGDLVTPNPTGGGPNRDGNWWLAYPYPTGLSPTLGPCGLKEFTRAWVDTPVLQASFDSWLPNDVSSASEWITPYDGEGNQPSGWFVYLTGFHVPRELPTGIVPSGLTINGRLASDNETYGFVLASRAEGGSCGLAEGLPTPIPDQFNSWTNFSFTNPIPITPDSDVILYVLVINSRSTGNPNATGLRVEFFDTSAFN